MTPPAPTDRFPRARVWIFDLDNTLYPPSAGLLGQIDVKMTDYIMRWLGVDREEAAALREHYWQRDGITLKGLMHDHGVEADAFLDATHALDLSVLEPAPHLADAIAALPGRKLIHTNGARGHAERVLAARGLTHVFDRVFAIEDKGLVPKPELPAYTHVVREGGFDPAEAVMIEDTPVNLVEPKRMGMGTVWLDHSEHGGVHHHVDLTIACLETFLRARR